MSAEEWPGKLKCVATAAAAAVEFFLTCIHT